MSWQTSEYYEEQRRQLRANQYIRLHENHFVASESQFISFEKWLACERSDLPPFPSKRLTVVIGMDLATKRDGAAICAVTRQPGNRIRVVAHRFWTPTRGNEINLSEVENDLREWCRKYRVHCIYYDPFQSEFLAQRLRHTLGKSRVKVFPQTPSNLELAANELYSAIEDRRLELYPNEEFRSQIRHVVAVETPRGGWRISKDKQSSRVDLVAALSFACTAAVEMPISNPHGLNGIHCIRMGYAKPVVSCPLLGGHIYDPECHHCDALLSFFDSVSAQIVEANCRRSTPSESVSEFVRQHPHAADGIYIASGGPPPPENKARHNFRYPKIQRG
jgi:phage terminase large subunit-like protein